jgi:hypothetical protein
LSEEAPSDIQCYRTSFSTDATTVYSSTYAFIGFVVFIDIAPTLAGFIPAYIYRNQADIDVLNVMCELMGRLLSQLMI